MANPMNLNSVIEITKLYEGKEASEDDQLSRYCFIISRFA
jgi:hypothetical protein